MLYFPFDRIIVISFFLDFLVEQKVTENTWLSLLQLSFDLEAANSSVTYIPFKNVVFIVTQTMNKSLFTE